MKKTVTIPEEKTSAKERTFEIFMGIAGVMGLVVPMAASSADFCRGSLGLFSIAPMIQAFIEYKFISSQDVCSFEWLFVEYSIVVFLGFMFFGRQVTPIYINRVKSNGLHSPKFWKFTIILCGCCLIGLSLLFLIYQYKPYASSLDKMIVAKIWFLTKSSLCLGSWAIGFSCFHVLWSIFDDRACRE